MEKDKVIVENTKKVETDALALEIEKAKINYEKPEKPVKTENFIVPEDAIKQSDVKEIMDLYYLGMNLAGIQKRVLIKISGVEYTLSKSKIKDIIKYFESIE